MPKRILRSFLYLDENIVDDYLSQLEGGILEGPYTTTDTTTGSKEGSGGLKIGVVEGSGKGASSSSSVVAQTIRETPVTKFTRLYTLLENEGAIQPLNGFDLDVYNQFHLGEIVEVRGNAKLPQWEHLTKAISDLSSLIEIMKAVGQDPFADNDDSQAYQGFSRRKEELETEATILGKVRRKLSERETIDIFRIAPRLNQLENLNRVQRRSMGKGKNKLPSTDTPLDEVIKYPAMQLQAIAVYL